MPKLISKTRNRTRMLLGSAAAVAIMASALPSAAPAASLDQPVQLAASHPCYPCAAKNPCAGKNPCAAKNPCAGKNPCAAKNPCGAKKGCNPCAAKTKM